jgi:AcrR family transcriptional regulator
VDGAIPSARTRARALVRADILAEARRQLAVEGAAGLSLRAVTRQLGMASSAVYRYFPSRDELLTALIVEAYDSVGEAAEEAVRPPGSVAERWRRVCHAIRDWALANPHEYALIYGSPVPGYRAPQLTVGPASRVSLVLTRLVVESRQGAIDRHHGEEEGPPDGMSPGMEANARHVGALVMPGVPVADVAMTLVVWTQLFGMISFELFGQLVGVTEDPEAFFDYAISVFLGLLGLADADPGYGGR